MPIDVIVGEASLFDARVSRAGRPVAGAEVHATRCADGVAREATTNAAGRAWLDFEPEDIDCWTVTVFVPGTIPHVTTLVDAPAPLGHTVFVDTSERLIIRPPGIPSPPRPTRHDVRIVITGRTEPDTFVAIVGEGARFEHEACVAQTGVAGDCGIEATHGAEVLGTTSVPDTTLWALEWRSATEPLRGVPFTLERTRDGAYQATVALDDEGELGRTATSGTAIIHVPEALDAAPMLASDCFGVADGRVWMDEPTTPEAAQVGVAIGTLMPGTARFDLHWHDLAGRSGGLDVSAWTTLHGSCEGSDWLLTLRPHLGIVESSDWTLAVPFDDESATFDAAEGPRVSLGGADHIGWAAAYSFEDDAFVDHARWQIYGPPNEALDIDTWLTLPGGRSIDAMGWTDTPRLVAGTMPSSCRLSYVAGDAGSPARRCEWLLSLPVSAR